MILKIADGFDYLLGYCTRRADVMHLLLAGRHLCLSFSAMHARRHNEIEKRQKLTIKKKSKVDHKKSS